MLVHLRVANLGVLAEAGIEPGNGLTVITGETGAGKTLLLGGLRLLIGEKSDPSAVGPKADSGQADGLFLVDGTELALPALCRPLDVVVHTSTAQSSLRKPWQRKSDHWSRSSANTIR